MKKELMIRTLRDTKEFIINIKNDKEQIYSNIFNVEFEERCIAIIPHCEVNDTLGNCKLRFKYSEVKSIEVFS